MYLELGYAIVFRGIFHQPASLNLGDIANEGLGSGLQDFMEYNPISFAVLDRKTRVSRIYQGKFTYNVQTSMNSDGRAESTRRSQF